LAYTLAWLGILPLLITRREKGGNK
jgi:hypothetical protein